MLGFLPPLPNPLPRGERGPIVHYEKHGVFPPCSYRSPCPRGSRLCVTKSTAFVCMHLPPPSPLAGEGLGERGISRTISPAVVSDFPVLHCYKSFNVQIPLSYRTGDHCLCFVSAVCI